MKKETFQSEQQLNELISATRIRLRQSSPFFAALALYSKIEFTETVPIAGTNGEKIFFHPRKYAELPCLERDAVFLHELLHAALLHPMREGIRDHQLFNVAADIVVNGMVSNEQNMKLPKGAIRDKELEHLSVEEVYENLLRRPNYQKVIEKLVLVDIINPYREKGDDIKKEKNELNELKNRYEIEGYWKKAINDSISIAKGLGHDDFPKSFKRHLDEITEPEVNWKTTLYRYLVKTPTDFNGYDRRFIHSGLYLEQLEGEEVEVFCCIDTSGSISDDELNHFIGELSGIINSYPNLKCNLWYADAECYGPYTIESIKKIPKPCGGGGTDFRPFFKKVKEIRNKNKEAVCIYLTDGYGDYPEEIPELPILWVITSCGLESEEIPFGEATRLTKV